jgi:hypothetical protein
VSLCLDVICSDHVGQFFGFICDELADIGEPTNTVAPRPPRHAVSRGSASIASISLSSFSGFSADLFLAAARRCCLHGKPDQHVKAGDPFNIPAGAIHDACTISGMKILAVQIIEKGKPRETPVS